MVLAAAPGRTNNPNGRPSNATLTARNATLREYNREALAEAAVLRDELARIGHQLVAAGTTLELGYNADRPDVVRFVRATVDSLGRSCLRKAGRDA